MHALDYEPGIKTIQFYMKLLSNPYKTHWNTTGIARNASTDIVLCTLFMTYLHDSSNLSTLGYVLYLPHASYSLRKHYTPNKSSLHRESNYMSDIMD